MRRPRGVGMAGILAFAALVAGCDLIAQNELDPNGLLFSSDPEDRFRASRELPQPASPGALAAGDSFLLVTDTHFRGKNHGKGSLWKQVEKTDKLILHCGDVAQKGNKDYYKEMLSYFKKLKVPYYIVPGNHDVYFSDSGAGWTDFEKAFGPSSFTFAAGSVRFIGLDSASGTLGAGQIAWLESVLDAKTEPYCVVFTHMNFFPDPREGLLYFGFSNYYERDELEYLFSAHGVNYVFSGHTHGHVVQDLGGVEYVICPSFDNDDSVRYIRFTLGAAGLSWVLVGDTNE